MRMRGAQDGSLITAKIERGRLMGDFFLPINFYRRFLRETPCFQMEEMIGQIQGMGMGFQEANGRLAGRNEACLRGICLR